MRVQKKKHLPIDSIGHSHNSVRIRDNLKKIISKKFKIRLESHKQTEVDNYYTYHMLFYSIFENHFFVFKDFFLENYVCPYVLTKHFFKNGLKSSVSYDGTPT